MTIQIAASSFFDQSSCQYRGGADRGLQVTYWVLTGGGGGSGRGREAFVGVQRRGKWHSVAPFALLQCRQGQQGGKVTTAQHL